MKLYFSLILMLVSAVSAMAAETEKFTLEVKDFTELKVTDGINVVYRNSTDSAGWAVFETTPLITSKIMFKNNKSCLHIQLATDGVHYQNLPTIYVYSSVLTKAHNDSDSTMTIAENCVVPDFKCSLVGNGTIIVKDIHADNIDASITTGKGNIILSGVANKATYSNLSSGPIEANELKAKEVSVKMLGTGNVDCTVTESLSIVGTGSGKVFFQGKPAKIKNRTLGVKTMSRDN